MNTEDNNSSTPQRSNTALWLLLASFLVPAILAYGYFFLGDRPDYFSNGKLITPVIDIEELKLKNASGELLSREELTPKWRMYFFAGDHCSKDCEERLYHMRQINIGLGKYKDRVEHGIVHLKDADKEFLQLIEKEHATAIALHSTDQDVSALYGNNTADAEKLFIYLVDPLGNIMMKFPADLNPKLILKDIKKLLKVSRIG